MEVMPSPSKYYALKTMLSGHGHHQVSALDKVGAFRDDQLKLGQGYVLVLIQVCLLHYLQENGPDNSCAHSVTQDTTRSSNSVKMESLSDIVDLAALPDQRCYRFRIRSSHPMRTDWSSVEWVPPDLRCPTGRHCQSLEEEHDVKHCLDYTLLGVPRSVRSCWSAVRYMREIIIVRLSHLTFTYRKAWRRTPFWRICWQIR